jgi:Fur family ferric uptake transcriptional regulator
VIDSNLKEKIVTRLQSRGLRMTHQRSAIIDAAFSTTDHYTAEELLAAARKTDPSVSRATIYRTLPLLVETGLLHELDLGKDHKVYDPNYATHPTHNHLICVDCHKIVEFEDDLLEEWENISASRRPANSLKRPAPVKTPASSPDGPPWRHLGAFVPPDH